MPERVIKIEPSTSKNKKYKAVVGNGKDNRIIHFGDNRYPQYKDKTPVGKYSHMDHGDKQRRKNYFMRHSGVDNKNEAIRKEYSKSKGKLNAKILSHKYLW